MQILMVAAALALAVPALPDLRTGAEVEDAVLSARLDTVVPMLMARHDVDMWVVAAREYNEDPVVETMLPATWPSARRTMILIFNRKPDGMVERLAVSRYPVGDFGRGWNPDEQPDQWARVADIVQARNPESIAVNISDDFGLADGLSVALHRQLISAIGPEMASRLVSHDGLALGWLETRIPAEMVLYRTIMRAAHAIIPQGLSDQVITPGVTSTQDVVWWYREQLAALKLDAWCQPSVSIQRQTQATFAIGTMATPRPQIIAPGDLLHVDFCAGALGLKTDTQQMAYVLKPGEIEAPAGLRTGLAAANRVQDALTSSFATGLTGNQILAAAREKAVALGLDPIIYTHPIGYHGHAAGTWIGAWDNQADVPGLGEYELNANTAWSIELAALHKVPEWNGQSVRFMLEVDAFFDGKTVNYIDGRQTELLLIPRNAQ